MTKTIRDEEAFEYHLNNFLQWLNVITMEPIEACNAWGNYNVAYELVTDLKNDGNAIITMKCSSLSKHQKNEVSNFLISLNAIPESLMVSATTVEANQEAMNHPCWTQFRKTAPMLASTLESAAKKNREFFVHQ